LEFHFYSGEEAGLKGSQAISEIYKTEKRPVVGMLQLDMTGYYDKQIGRKMGIVGDFTDLELTDLLRLVVDEYTDESTGRLETTCAYACSGIISQTMGVYFRSFVVEEGWISICVCNGNGIPFIESEYSYFKGRC
jgi:leucyl aminopeptidase